MQRCCNPKRKAHGILSCYALIAVGASVLVGCGIPDPSEFGIGGATSDGSYMEYEEERFQTSKQYTDWDEFKEDPNNYLASETERMQEAVRNVKFLSSAADRETVMQQMFDKQFPGFGCGQLGILDRDQLDSCAAFLIEIPRSKLHRHAGYVKVNDRFVLVADFEAPEIPMIAMIAIGDGHLNFYGIDKSLLHRVPLPNTK